MLRDVGSATYLGCARGGIVVAALTFNLWWLPPSWLVDRVGGGGGFLILSAATNGMMFSVTSSFRTNNE